MSPRDFPRAAVTVAVLALFAYAYMNNPNDEMMKGALIAAFTTAVSWWLGSSKGSADKSEELSRQSRETQTVTIDQPADDPVPTTDTGDGKP